MRRVGADLVDDSGYTRKAGIAFALGYDTDGIWEAVTDVALALPMKRSRPKNSML